MQHYILDCYKSEKHALNALARIKKPSWLIGEVVHDDEETYPMIVLHYPNSENDKFQYWLKHFLNNRKANAWRKAKLSKLLSE